MRVALIVAGSLLLVMAVFALVGRRQYPWTAADSARSERAGAAEPYWDRVLVAGDVFLNVCSGGKPCMTISTRCWIWSLRPHGHLVQKFLNRVLSVIQRDHGPQAASGDLGRCQATTADIQAALTQIAGPARAA